MRYPCGHGYAHGISMTGVQGLYIDLHIGFQPGRGVLGEQIGFMDNRAHRHALQYGINGMVSDCMNDWSTRAGYDMTTTHFGTEGKACRILENVLLCAASCL
jgi:hypothetical protein